jgi:hypothetical protein
LAVAQRLSEAVARRTTRRGLFGRGAQLAFGALAGAAAGAAARGLSRAGDITVCVFPGRPCECAHCQENGVCAKPCIFNTFYYASGCWVTEGITCCDCTCPDILDLEEDEETVVCGCGSDYHNDPSFCPEG